MNKVEKLHSEIEAINKIIQGHKNDLTNLNSITDEQVLANSRILTTLTMEMVIERNITDRFPDMDSINKFNSDGIADVLESHKRLIVSKKREIDYLETYVKKVEMKINLLK